MNRQTNIEAAISTLAKLDARRDALGVFAKIAAALEEVDGALGGFEMLERNLAARFPSREELDKAFARIDARLDELFARTDTQPAREIPGHVMHTRREFSVASESRRSEVLGDPITTGGTVQVRSGTAPAKPTDEPTGEVLGEATFDPATVFGDAVRDCLDDVNSAYAEGYRKGYFAAFAEAHRFAATTMQRLRQDARSGAPIAGGYDVNATDLDETIGTRPEDDLAFDAAREQQAFGSVRGRD